MAGLERLESLAFNLVTAEVKKWYRPFYLYTDAQYAETELSTHLHLDYQRELFGPVGLDVLEEHFYSSLGSDTSNEDKWLTEDGSDNDESDDDESDVDKSDVEEPHHVLT